MLQTVWRSYFERPGLRAPRIVPEKITGEILPLTVEPSPRNQVRVLVGRSELLTPSFEQELVKQFALTNQNQNAWASDRYFGGFRGAPQRAQSRAVSFALRAFDKFVSLDA